MADTESPFPKHLPKPPVYDHQQKRKKRRRETAYIYLDDDAVEAYEEARQEAERAVRERDVLKEEGKQVPKDLRDRIARLLEAEEAARETLVENTAAFIFQGLPHHEWDELTREHPPQDEDHEEYRRSLIAAGMLKGELKNAPEILANVRAQTHNKTFAPALIKACLVEPKMAEEEVDELLTDLNEPEISRLFVAAQNASQGLKRVPSLERAWG